MDRQKAVEKAREYCIEKKYSVARFDELYKQFIDGTLWFLHFPDIKPDGLANDMETQGIPVLSVDQNYNVQEEQGADKWLYEN